MGSGRSRVGLAGVGRDSEASGDSKDDTAAFCCFFSIFELVQKQCTHSLCLSWIGIGLL